MAQRIVLNTISYHGKGAIQEIPNEITSRGYKKVFVCTDPDLIKFGVAAKVTDVLSEASICYEIFSDIKANPTIENVLDGVKAFKESGADSIVAIGGGSSMDTAKGRPINIPYTLKKSSYNNSAWSRKNTAKGVTTAAEIRYNFFLLATLSNRTLPKIPNDIPRTAPTITSLG